jgi:hypothetical protein
MVGVFSELTFFGMLTFWRLTISPSIGWRYSTIRLKGAYLSRASVISGDEEKKVLLPSLRTVV